MWCAIPKSIKPARFTLAKHPVVVSGQWSVGQWSEQAEQPFIPEEMVLASRFRQSEVHHKRHIAMKPVIMLKQSTFDTRGGQSLAVRAWCDPYGWHVLSPDSTIEGAREGKPKHMSTPLPNRAICEFSCSS